MNPSTPRVSLAFCRHDSATVALVVVMHVLTTAAAIAQPPGGGKPAPAPVKADRVRLEPAHSRAVSFVGTIKPLNTSLVSSSVEGLVEEYLVNEGDYAVAGTVLAKLRTVDLEIEKKRAEADLSLMELEKEELELSEPREIEKSRAEKAASEALLKFAADRLARVQKLLRTSPDVVSQEELEESISAEAAARENYLAKVAAFELASGGLWKKRIDQAGAKVEAQQQAIGLIEDELEQHTIRAPFAGYVTTEFTEVGQWVAKGGAVAEMIQIHEVDLEVAVLEAYAPNLRVGLEGTIGLDTYSDQIFTGSVALVVPSADPQSRSFPVKIRIKNQQQEMSSPGDAGTTPQMQLMPGMFARANLPVGNSQDLHLVHKDALVLERTEKSVFVVDLDSETKTPGVGTVRNVPVRLGVFYNDYVEVYGDLHPGEIVVTEGNERLNQGRNVRIVNFSELPRHDSAASQVSHAAH
jgi:HlyD family secretion protein